ncbi:hypothetical protein GJ744_012457 [Endocarpon pusillum]|uniref:Uncharacterized protein n=1 Tax=Endocarpon pusillum TaxID=364733 RepID=A0A8H7ADS7_9EURO|nr:hypothetical protein GJ744_012457 [Endocarpon pusillum]
MGRLEQRQILQAKINGRHLSRVAILSKPLQAVSRLAATLKGLEPWRRLREEHQSRGSEALHAKADGPEDHSCKSDLPGPAA